MKLENMFEFLQEFLLFQVQIYVKFLAQSMKKIENAHRLLITIIAFIKFIKTHLKAFFYLKYFEEFQITKTTIQMKSMYLVPFFSLPKGNIVVVYWLFGQINMQYTAQTSQEGIKCAKAKEQLRGRSQTTFIREEGRQLLVSQKL